MDYPTGYVNADLIQTLVKNKFKSVPDRTSKPPRFMTESHLASIAALSAAGITSQGLSLKEFQFNNYI